MNLGRINEFRYPGSLFSEYNIFNLDLRKLILARPAFNHSRMGHPYVCASIHNKFIYFSHDTKFETYEGSTEESSESLSNSSHGQNTNNSSSDQMSSAGEENYTESSENSN